MISIWTNAAKKKALADAEKIGISKLNDDIISFDLEHKENQKKLIKEFDIKDFDFFPLNIWDERSDDGFNLYLELSHFPDNVCFEILNTIKNKLQDAAIAESFFQYYDSTVVYPRNVTFHSGRLTSYKRWELVLTIEHEEIDAIVDIINSMPGYKGVKFSAFSES